MLHVQHITFFWIVLKCVIKSSTCPLSCSFPSSEPAVLFSAALVVITFTIDTSFMVVDIGKEELEGNAFPPARAPWLEYTHLNTNSNTLSHIGWVTNCTCLIYKQVDQGYPDHPDYHRPTGPWWFRCREKGTEDYNHQGDYGHEYNGEYFTAKRA